jgi:hypothetical protein
MAPHKKKISVPRMHIAKSKCNVPLIKVPTVKAHSASYLTSSGVSMCPSALSVTDVEPALEMNVELDSDFPETFLFDPVLFSASYFSCRKSLTPPKSKFLLHIVPKSLSNDPKKYVPVALFHRQFLDCSVMVACCGLCETSSHTLQVFEESVCLASPSSCAPDLESCLHVAIAAKNALYDLGIEYSKQALYTLAANCVEPVLKRTGWWHAGNLEGVSHQMWLVVSKLGYIGLLAHTHHGLKCHVCSSWSCVHTRVKEGRPQNLVTLPKENEKNPEDSLLKNLLHSKQTYPFECVEFWSFIENRTKNYVSELDSYFPKNDTGCYEIFPEKKLCDCGSELERFPCSQTS